MGDGGMQLLLGYPFHEGGEGVVDRGDDLTIGNIGGRERERREDKGLDKSHKWEGGGVVGAPLGGGDEVGGRGKGQVKEGEQLFVDFFARVH